MHYIPHLTKWIITILLFLKLQYYHRHGQNRASVCNVSLLPADCGSLGLEKPEIEAAFLRVAQGRDLPGKIQIRTAEYSNLHIHLKDTEELNYRDVF